MHKKTVCPLDCPDSCGIIATVDDGKVVSLAGDKEHPMTQGFLCRKMMSYPERLYSENRVLHPLLRTGTKGSGEFKQISWDEAWEILTEKLTSIIKEYGGESVFPFCYAGNMGRVHRFAGFPFFHKIGATRIDQTICSAAASGGWKKQCQGVPGSPSEKVRDSEVVVCWGINAKVSNVHFWQMVVEAKKRGAKLIVIDPYKTITAKSADLHIPVKPSGDTPLAFGILKKLLENYQINKAKILSFSEGFEKYCDYVDNLSWDTIVEQSGVSLDQIEQLGNLFTDHEKTFFRIGVGLTRNSRGGSAIRSITSLAASLGLYSGDKGKGVLAFAGAFKGGETPLLHEELLPKQTRTVNMIHCGTALTSLTPKVKAFIVYNANPLSVAPDSSKVREGMLREDLFTVVHEQVMTGTAKYADLVLPATTFLENRDIYTSYGHFGLKVVDAVIPAVGEAMSNFDFFQTLGVKMGFDDPAFHETVDDRIRMCLEDIQGLPEDSSIDDILSGTFIESTFKYMERDSIEASGTKFTFCSDVVQDGFPDVKNCKEFDDIDLSCRFPLKLITPPHIDLLNSTFGERYEGNPGKLLIHPKDAERYGIVDEQNVQMSNFRGKTIRTAHISDDTQEGLVVAEGIFWPFEGKTGINELVSQNVSDIGGGALFHESRVKVEKI